MAKRQWNTWPHRFSESLKDTNGIIGLIGVGLTAAGATISSPVTLTIGAITIGGSAVYAAIRGVPPKMRQASEFVGQNVSLETLQSINPPILKLGIVGYTQSGKTTFLKQALQQITETNRTSNVYATILTLQTSPTKYIALLDGDGEQFPQQYQVAADADILIVLVDHNQGNNMTEKSLDRIEDHNRFLKQLEYYIRSNKPLEKLHLIMNKRDLWESSTNSKELREWFENHVNDWKRSNIAKEVTSSIHSNLIANDMTKINRYIIESAQEYD